MLIRYNIVWAGENIAHSKIVLNYERKVEYKGLQNRAVNFENLSIVFENGKGSSKNDQYKLFAAK